MKTLTRICQSLMKAMISERRSNFKDGAVFQMLTKHFLGSGSTEGWPKIVQDVTAVGRRTRPATEVRQKRRDLPEKKILWKKKKFLCTTDMHARGNRNGPPLPLSPQNEELVASLSSQDVVGFGILRFQLNRPQTTSRTTNLGREWGRRAVRIWWSPCH